MKLDRIRNMNDEELAAYLKRLSNKRSDNLCIKCNNKADFFVKIENCDTFQTKKLCGLCEDCYNNLLEHLGTFDVIWND